MHSRPETGSLHPMAIESRLFLNNEKHVFLGIYLRAAGRPQFRSPGVSVMCC
jgi:hypothetical protein